MDQELQTKWNRLNDRLRELGGVAVGYSGGIDSTLLAKVAHDVLGANAPAVMAVSESYPQSEREEAMRIANDLGLDVVQVHTNELAVEGYRRNLGDRCAYCKSELTEHLLQVARERDLPHVAIGVNVDDLGDYRPGQEAASRLGAVMPMVDAGLTKSDVRALARELGIPIWDKPAFACLSSRFPYGEEITAEKLAQVEAAEDVLRQAGFKQFRVRYHRDVARIEVPVEDFALVLERRNQIVEGIRATGFLHVALDLFGFKSGSLNAALKVVQIGAAEK